MGLQDPKQLPPKQQACHGNDPATAPLQSHASQRCPKDAGKQGFDNKYFEEKLDDSITDFAFKIGEGVNADDFFGYASTVFAKEYSKNKYEIIAIMPGAESTVVELGAEDVEAISATEVEYYADADKYNTKKYKLDSATVYYNYVSSTEIAVNSACMAGGDVEITLIDNDADNKYEFVIAKEYSYDRVDSVEAARSRVNGIANTFVFDFEDDTKIITIVDENGEDIVVWAVTEKGEVLAESKNVKAPAKKAEGGNK